MEQQELG